MYKQRRINYLNKIKDTNISIFFSGEKLARSADAHYKYCVNKDFLYLTGLEREKMALILMNDGEKQFEYLYIEENTELIEKWDGARMSKEEASKISKIDIKNIRYFDALLNDIKSFKTGGRQSNCDDIEDYYFAFGLQKDLRLNEFIENLTKTYPDINVKSSKKTMALLRMIKDEKEIEEMSKAIEIIKTGIYSLMSNAKDSKTENELLAYYMFELQKHDVKESFDTIAANGKNATVLHYGDNNDLLNHENLMLFDLGVEYKGYCSDISRTFPLSGKFTDLQKEIYEIVLKSNKETIKIIKPGLTWAQINKVARDILVEGLIKHGLIKEAKEISKYYFHGVGHFLGLDVHDVGEYKVPLQAGAVITVEPGLYIKEYNIGIRIEDDILVTEDGCINLSESIIKEVEDIENFMKK